MLVTAIAPIAWGSSYVVTRQLLPEDSPLWGGLLRALPAGLILLLISRRLPTGSWWWRSLVLGALNVGGFFVLIYIAGQRLPSSLAATLMSTSALVMMLFAWAMLRQRPRVIAVLGALVGLAGVAIMLGFGGGPVDCLGRRRLARAPWSPRRSATSSRRSGVPTCRRSRCRRGSWSAALCC